MPPVPITLRQGVTEPVRVSVFSDNATPVDLTQGWRVRMQGRQFPGAPGDPLFDLDSSAGSLILGADGYAVGEITHTVTATLPPKTPATMDPEPIGFYESIVISPEGTPFPGPYGPILVIPGVVR